MTTGVLPFTAHRPRARAEEAIQAGIVEFLRAILPPALFRVFAVPNGGQRPKAEAARMKRTGTLAGVFDVCILGPQGASYWIETKTDDGGLSKPQREMRDFMVEAGVPHAVARSIGEAEQAVRGWGLPVRGRAS